MQYALAVMDTPVQHVGNAGTLESNIDTDSPPPSYESVALHDSAESGANLAPANGAVAASSSASMSASSVRSLASLSNSELHPQPSNATSNSGGSPHHIRLLNFDIEYRQHNIHVVLQDTNTVGRCFSFVMFVFHNHRKRFCRENFLAVFVCGREMSVVYLLVGSSIHLWGWEFWVIEMLGEMEL